MPIPLMHQAAILKAITGHDGYGAPITTSTNIVCRFLIRAQNVRTLEGDTIESHAFVSLKEIVKPGDIINYQGAELPYFYNKDYPILGTVKAVTDLSGTKIKWMQVVI